MVTTFVEIYNRFLKQITDDLYVELTPEDTVRDLRDILIEALPRFEFPRKNLMNYTISTDTINQSEVTENDFVMGLIWNDVPLTPPAEQQVLIEKSSFAEELTPEEQNIIALLMMDIWLQRQVTSIENTRMKYSGSDFKMTSQANHLSKLITLQEKVKQAAHHYQRLYKRRRFTDDGLYRSNWDIFGVSAIDD